MAEFIWDGFGLSVSADSTRRSLKACDWSKKKTQRVACERYPDSPHLLLSPSHRYPFSYHRLDTSGAGGVRCLVLVVFLWDSPGEAERSHRVGFIAVRPFDHSAESGRDLFSVVMTRSACCDCLCPPSGRASRALVLSVSSDVTHLIP
jgi:hypothetical protein